VKNYSHDKLENLLLFNHIMVAQTCSFYLLQFFWHFQFENEVALLEIRFL